ncbi:sulfatase-like hydrolase/transferase [Halosquirtibacter xylanolyticus]|uniref:sulfatase-like hydrolase/transferase n=1 Tax=Halosquirtibacter xylanolyticus TaxID=3374599 RepID=UPI003747BA28|nr:sulfatase-like hydrolase/transferase [Prolixibacteraceae bacterium]
MHNYNLNSRFKTIIHRLSFILLLLILVDLPSNAAGKRKQPNILLLFSDDHQATAINALGNPYIQTPNIDKLVDEGTTFTKTFTETPTCAPSRTALLTGCGSLTHGTFYPKYSQSVNKNLKRWPQTMKDAGYETFWTGKFNTHGKPMEWGVDQTARIFPRGMGDHEMSFKENGKTITGFSSELFADAMINFINQKHDKPFFATIAFTAPHDPRTPPGKYATMYKPNEVPLPANLLSHYNYNDGYDQIRDEVLIPYPRDIDTVRKEIADYYGMISHMDTQIGRILDALEKSGIDKNTIVIYASDNGLAIGHHGLMGKFSFYGHSLQVPLIMRGPKIPENYRTDTYVYLHDLFPTICDMTDISIPETVESKSFLSVLKKKKQPIHEYMFGALSNLKRSVSTREYKLIRHYKSKTENKGTDEYLFFDLRNDPLEIKNEINNPLFASKISELKEELKREQIAKKDFLDPDYQ